MLLMLNFESFSVLNVSLVASSACSEIEVPAVQHMALVIDVAMMAKLTCWSDLPVQESQAAQEDSAHAV